MHRTQRRNGSFKGFDKKETPGGETDGDVGEGIKMTIMSKTTYKLRTYDDSQEVPGIVENEFRPCIL